ncbi:MAG TPA: pantetheine-phosphate adenylyltransferase [Bacteroidales bacterium]|nr:pantetheine-phosphate adenylyltransferase [Bacteroidales bacterium]
MKIAIFPGSFDPITKGHENLIYRASYLFDKLIVAIGENSQKHSFFPLDLRKNWVQTTIKKLSNVNVDVYNGLTVDYCKNIGAKYIVRGIRTFADFEFENHIA